MNFAVFSVNCFELDIIILSNLFKLDQWQKEKKKEKKGLKHLLLKSA